MSTYSVFLKPGELERFTGKHPIVSCRILGRHTGRFTGKLVQTKCYISYMVSGKQIRVDEFSSKTPRKMKISEKFLDEFSMICH